MSFDYKTATPQEITARLEKFKRRAPMVIDQDQFTLILKSFPPEQHEEVFAEVVKLVPFEAEMIAEETP